MSYKCAIFGHKYGDVEVEREREEDGKEVIITVRETETCARCENTRVVSENKEVTTLETAADIVADDLADDSEPATEPPSEEMTQPTATSGAEYEPEIPEAEPDTSGDELDPEEDDAVILDDSDEPDGAVEPTGSEEETAEAGRDPGEWPEEDTADGTQSQETMAWPEENEEETDEGPAWDLPSDIDPHPETEQRIERSGGDALTVPEGEFYCPECGFRTQVESSSLRAGDFCPECHKGTLEHQRD